MTTQLVFFQKYVMIAHMPRKYEHTHPWITFSCDLRQVNHQIWISLGEAHSKCEHIAGVLLTPAIAAEMHRLFLAKGIFATTAIEGNTLTEKEVRSYLEGNLQLPASKQYLAQEMDNVETALDLIFQETLNRSSVGLTVERIKEYNRIILDGLQLEDRVVAGEVRLRDVVVGGVYRGAPPEDCDYLLNRLCEWLNDPAFCPQNEGRVVYGLLRAILAHLYIAWIHAFGDGNGRTARLIEFEILTSSGVPSPAAHLLSNHYNQTRPEYYRRLDEASKSGGNIWPFVSYAVNGFTEGLKEQIKLIKEQQLTVAWRDYVYNVFHNKNSKTDERQRYLALDLSERVVAVPLAQIRDLSPRVAASYATKTPKTLLRDLVELQKLDLVEKTPQGYRAKREIMLAFLPECRLPEQV